MGTAHHFQKHTKNFLHFPTAGRQTITRHIQSPQADSWHSPARMHPENLCSYQAPSLSSQTFIRKIPAQLMELHMKWHRSEEVSEKLVVKVKATLLKIWPYRWQDTYPSKNCKQSNTTVINTRSSGLIFFFFNNDFKIKKPDRNRNWKCFIIYTLQKLIFHSSEQNTSTFFLPCIKYFLDKLACICFVKYHHCRSEYNTKKTVLCSLLFVISL